jgi:hypothetical protein
MVQPLQLQMLHRLAIVSLDDICRLLVERLAQAELQHQEMLVQAV